MKRASIPLFLVAAAMCAPARVLACGVCIEDKVAAAYDHAVIRHAIEKRQQVVFVAVDGPVDGGEVGTKVAKANVPGVVAGTLRVSTAPAAFSFALDAGEEPARAVAGFRKAVRDPRAKLTLVRIVRDGKLITP